MSLTIRNYREVTRNYLLKLLQKHEYESKNGPISVYEKNLAQDLDKVGFFSHNKKIIWWRQEIDPKTFKCFYTPILDNEPED